MDGKFLQQDVQGFRLLGYLENTNQYVAVGRLIDSRKAKDKGYYEYEIEFDDAQLRSTSRSMKNREDVRVRLEFTASNRDRATVSGVAGTSPASIDVVMPPKTQQPVYYSYPAYQQGGKRHQVSNDRSVP